MTDSYDVSQVLTDLGEMVREARTLRASLGPMPGSQAAPHEVHEYLLDVRRRLDRTEQHLVQALRVRNATRRLGTAAGHVAEDDWDAAILRIRKAPVRRGDEYSSARERTAEANLATVDVRRQARDRAGDLDLAEGTVEVLRLIHRGLDGVRHDTLAVLRQVAFESHLER